MNVTYQKFKPHDLWVLAKTKPSPAKNMVLNFKKIKNGKKTGFGIYALSYIHPNGDELLIYIGKFAGTMSRDGSIDNATDGDVRDRWFKHIGTATLLLAGLRMNNQVSFDTHQKKSRAFYKDDTEFLKSSESSILGLDSKTLKSFVFKKNGNQISNNRLGFAIQNLTSTNATINNDLKNLNEIISKFSCHYWQISFGAPIRKSQIKPLIEGTKKCPGVEKIVISTYRDRLPMNDEFAPENGFYHYDQKKLINVNSEDFITLDNYIRAQIQNIFSVLK
jgi:hypothetical protein